MDYHWPYMGVRWPIPVALYGCAVAYTSCLIRVCGGLYYTHLMNAGGQEPKRLMQKWCTLDEWCQLEVIQW